MNKTLLSWIVVIIIVAGGWYWLTVGKTTDTADTDNMTPSSDMGLNGSVNQTNTGEAITPVVTVSNDATLGDYLVASNGMTLYLYTKDTKNVSNCYDQCAVNWPPYVISNSSMLVSSATATGTLGTITRTDGQTQLTYNGLPLYFWKNDAKVGDTTGQNVGGVWFVVKP